MPREIRPRAKTTREIKTKITRAGKIRTLHNKIKIKATKISKSQNLNINRRVGILTNLTSQIITLIMTRNKILFSSLVLFALIFSSCNKNVVFTEYRKFENEQ